MMRFFRSRLSPFRYRDFRLFFLTQSVSLIGTWAHELARAWIALDLMGRASALGMILLASSLPGLFLSLQGGVLVDRLNVRKLLMATKGLLALFALIVGFVVEFSEIKLWHLIVFALLEGSILAFDAPTFQAVSVRLVPRSDFQQAIALNSTNYHLARMVGPMVAGLLMAWSGPALVFFVDATSFLGLIFVLSSVTLRSSRTSGLPPQRVRNPAREGLRYLLNHPQIRYMLSQLLVTICLMVPMMMVVFRTFVQRRFQLTADEFGYLLVFPAMGGLIGALCFAAFKPQLPMRALRWGIPLLMFSVLSMAFARSSQSAAILMGLSGFGLYLCFSSMTVSLHLAVADEYRGRLGSLISMGFSSIGPLMCFPIGVLADWIGYERMMILTAVTFGLVSLTLAISNRQHLRSALIPNERITA